MGMISTTFIRRNDIIKTYIVNLATFVEGDLKSPFSIATTLRCRGECYSIPWITPFYP